MSGYHHLTSAFSRLTTGSIDFVVECVRDATEVLHGSETLDPRDMIRMARSVFDTERSFELDPQAFVDTLDLPRSDWTLACMAEGLMEASLQLSRRGAHDAARRARSDWRAVVQRLVDSTVQSPLLHYGTALSALIDHCPPDDARDRLTLLRRYLADDLRTNNGANVLHGLRSLGEAHLRLKQSEIAFSIFTALVRHDPLHIWTHLGIAEALQHDFPALAAPAAERGLLLMPREDTHGVRPRLRAIIERTRNETSQHMSGSARTLATSLQAKPGKRSRSSPRTLCMEVAPEIDRVPVRDEEPLPDAAGLTQLRGDLHTLPRPRRELPVRPVPAQAPREGAMLVGARAPMVLPTPSLASAPSRNKVGRNEPCTCGSNKKWKRCCGAR